MNKNNLVCTCDHFEIDHKGLDETIEERLNVLVKNDILIPQYSPDRFKPTGYIFRSERTGKIYSYEAVENLLVNLRTNYSSCTVGDFFNACGCARFKADNLKYLEMIYDEYSSR